MGNGTTVGRAGSRREQSAARDGRWRIAGALAVIGMIAAAAWWLTRGDGDDLAELAAVPPADLVVLGDDPGATGAATEVALEPPPAEEVDRWCGAGGGAAAGSGTAAASTGSETCRVTVALANPPTARRSGGRGGAKPRSPVDVERPGSLGAWAMHDAADPTVLVDGQTYYLFSTSAKFLRVPVAVVPASDLVPDGSGTFSIRHREPVLPDWARAALGITEPPGEPALTTDPRTVPRNEAMPDKPAWAAGDDIWAPSVARFGNRYVMFFASQRPDPPDAANRECIGRAVATHPAGPYVPDPTPVTCGIRGVHGALDPSVFRDRTTGRVYLLAAFGGTRTPLWSIPLTSDGLAADGARPLLAMQQPWESWFLENPTMVFNGTDYTLAYSAGRWWEPTYSTGVARCATPLGPCTSRRDGPWLATTGDVSGPGGLDFFPAVDGGLMAVYHGYRAGAEARFGARHTFIRPAYVDERVVRLGSS